MTGLPKRRDFCEARGLIDHRHFTNQAIIVKTLESKSLLPYLYKREEFPSLKNKPGVRGDFHRVMSFLLWTP
jgi:hypothetical protein